MKISETKVKLILGLMTIITLAVIFNTPEYDSSDDKENGVRSGLIIRTDYGTGCEYLETVRGGITPRMINGKQMGCTK